MDKRTLALIGCNTPSKAVEALERLGFLPVILPSDTRLSPVVCSHADMLLFPLAHNIFCSREYSDRARAVFELLEDYGYNVVKCDVEIAEKYPDDTPFNIAVCQGYMISNTARFPREIAEYAKNNGFYILPVKQGYSKCSSLVLGNSAIISADSGILRAASSCGIPTLKITNSPNAVSLDGYNYGFIGGACGVFDSTVYFVGDVGNHPEGDMISDFCCLYGFKVESLTTDQLCDVGGIFFLPPINRVD